MLFEKDCGVILHPSSLPGPYGIGEIGPQALHWIDCLSEMRQNLWQVLPLGPTGYGESPYQCHSSFAGNTLLISIAELLQEGLLEKKDLADMPVFSARSCEYEKLLPYKRKLLDQAARCFLSQATTTEQDAFASFCKEHSTWLDDFSHYMAIKRSFNLAAWVDWPTELRSRNEKALAESRLELNQAINIEKVLQFLFDRQWQKIRRAAYAKGVRIIGDIPIFVAHDSADVWAQPELFKLNKHGQPTVVAGVPPDYFSATGQRWGNPHYDWSRHRQDNFSWWLKRVERCLDWSDVVRIDHFRGFEAAWEIPAHEPTAINGQWIKAPGRELFQVIRDKFGNVSIIAEDLGVITAEVEALRDDFELPGLRILQFAFGSDDQSNSFYPSQYVQNCVAYSGTHDNDTVVGWFKSKPGEGSTRTEAEIVAEKKRVLDFLGTDGSEIHWDFIRVLLESKAGAVLYQLQDVLGLGSEARMNIPGTMGNNWRWRFEWHQLDQPTIKRLADLTLQSGRGVKR